MSFMSDSLSLSVMEAVPKFFRNMGWMNFKEEAGAQSVQSYSHDKKFEVC